MFYPTSLPDRNKFTVPKIGAVDLSLRDTVILDCPRKYSRLVYGMLSLLGEVYIYQQGDALTPQELVDIYNNEVLIMRDVCRVFADCVENSPELRTALQKLIEDTSFTGSSIPGGRDAIDPLPGGSLDCLYGGVTQWLSYAFAVADDWIVRATSAVDLLQEALSLFTFGLSDTLRTLVAITSGVSLPLVRSEIASPAFQEGYFCRAFAYFANLDNPLEPSVDDIAGYIQTEQDFNPNAQGIFYAVLSNLATGDLLRRMYLGFDECDNDWLLCPNLDKITVQVPATTINGVTVTLPSTGSYAVSVTGEYVYNASGCTADGLYALDGPSCTNVILSPRLQILTASGWDDLIPDSLSYSEGRGYQFQLSATSVQQELRIFDDDYLDNSGDLTVRFLKLS